MDKILFIQTGGTIDKAYPQNPTNHGYAFAIDEPASRVILERARPGFEYEIKTVLKKDSLDMTDADRTIIRETIETAPNSKIIITHGTDALQQTAEFLRNLDGKTIVLTGAMQPEKFRDSDADFNLGMAVACVQTLPSAVYITLSGEVRKIS
ncbi:MAG TPA: asparaginase domain-containing protein [Candidatus Saccharimonadales bacterium]